MSFFRRVAVTAVKGGVGLPIGERDDVIDLKDCAIAAMTDLRASHPISVDAAANLADAHAEMLRRKVRLLFVVDDLGLPVGVLTAYEILGERPIQISTGEGVPVMEIGVTRLMRPLREMAVFEYEALLSARVGDVFETLRQLGEKYALVFDGAERSCLRGIISARQIALRAAVSLDDFELPSSFWQVEAVLAQT